MEGAAVALLHHLRFARSQRFRRATAATAMVSGFVGAVVMMASPASAEMRCTGRPESNVCLSIEPTPDGRDYYVHVGIDIHMSLAEAQRYVGQGSPLTAKIMGSDTFSDDFRFFMRVTDLGASADSGLSADFDYVASQSQMNEDDSIFDDVDEIYATIDLYDAQSGRHFSYRSDTFEQVF
jgi:hypothetical protein